MAYASEGVVFVTTTAYTISSTVRRASSIATTIKAKKNILASRRVVYRQYRETTTKKI
jgi:hypothetical protein